MQHALALEKPHRYAAIVREDAEALKRLLFISAFVNLLIVSLLGILLRTYPFFSITFISYKNLLHGHSHFAFGGWVMPAILALLLKCFPDLERAVAYKHWSNIGFLLLSSAYGMLISFPLQGYKALSVSFSTLSVVAGFYLAVVTWRALPKIKSSVALKFFASGLVYLVISAAGPFATGPLIAMGKAGTTLYYDAIYFYLHFQYNGWFSFAVLALLYNYLQKNEKKTNGRKVLWLMNLACVPSFFLSVLWHQPGLVFNVVGGIGALLQCFAVVFVVQDARKISFDNRFVKMIVNISLFALVTKALLQFFGAFPAVADFAYQQRNLIIAYLHLVLLGFISLFFLAWFIKHYAIAAGRQLKTGLALFLLGFVSSELLLLIGVFGLWPGDLQNSLILFVSMLMPAGFILLLREVFRSSAKRSQ